MNWSNCSPSIIPGIPIRSSGVLMRGVGTVSDGALEDRSEGVLVLFAIILYPVICCPFVLISITSSSFSTDFVNCLKAVSLKVG